MIIKSLSYRGAEAVTQETLPLDRRVQVLRCADAHYARRVSRAVHQMIVGGASREESAGDAGCRPVEEIEGISLNIDMNASEPYVKGNGACAARASDWALLTLDEMAVEDGDGMAGLAAVVAALADSGDPHRDMPAALARLDAYIVALGRGDAALTTRARMHLDALKVEWKAVTQARADARRHNDDLRQSLEQMKSLRKQRDVVRSTLSLAVVERAHRLQDRLYAIEESVRGRQSGAALDSNQAAAIQRAETLVETARIQLERTRQELDEILHELDIPEDADGTTQNTARVELPDQLQREMRDTFGRISEINARLDELHTQIKSQDDYICAAQEQLTTLPDFTRIAPNPVDWLNQLARSFKTALLVRDKEVELRDRLRAEVADLRAEIAGDVEVFRDCDHFGQQMVEYDQKKKNWAKTRQEITERQQQHRGALEELQESTTGLFFLAMGCSLFFSLILGAFVGLGGQRTPMLYPAGLLLLSAIYFMARLVFTRRRIAQLTQGMAEAQAELDVLTDEETSELSLVDRLLARTSCTTPRELEARYDRYRERRAKLDALEERYAQQVENTQEAEQRIPRLFARVQSTLEQVDESPGDEDDVEGAVGRAIAKYQIYRETKRRLVDLRNQHQSLLGRKRFLDKELGAARERLPVAERKLRALMAENGFVQEAEYKDINAALSAYYRFVDITEEVVNRRELLAHQQDLMERRVIEESALYQRHKGDLRALLDQAQVESVEQARQAAGKTTVLRDLEAERAELEAQLETLLQGRPLEAFQAQVDADAREGSDTGDPETLGRELEELERKAHEATEAYRMVRQRRRDCLAGRRSLNEIEEDRAALETKIAAMRADLAAAALAMALMEEAMTIGRAAFSAALSKRSEALLAAAGCFVLVELDIDPNSAAGIHVVVDEAAPGGVQLEGTVYLAMRLAAIEVLNGDTWPVPLVIDGALQDAVMPVSPDVLLDLLAQCAQKGQVLLVTEQAEIIEAAQHRQLPVITLSQPA